METKVRRDRRALTAHLLKRRAVTEVINSTRTPIPDFSVVIDKSGLLVERFAHRPQHTEAASLYLFISFGQRTMLLSWPSLNSCRSEMVE